MDRYLDLNDLWGIPSLEDQTLALAKRLRSIRKSKGWNQTEFADRSGIPLGTLKVFETKGKISLKHLFRYAIAVDRVDELNALFTRHEPTLEEMRNGKYTRITDGFLSRQDSYFLTGISPSFLRETDPRILR